MLQLHIILLLQMDILIFFSIYIYAVYFSDFLCYKTGDHLCLIATFSAHFSVMWNNKQ